ncbi:HAD family hydrolase [Ectothiorhodospiraceae bacterium BW-2]|nr:HAD family hydrolase [Ectothiorhodospiraceae bacterium BW-2]
MPLALFDLDNTLIAADSDHLWGEFLVERGVVDREYYGQQNDHFYAQYREGTLDIYQFLRFSLKPLSQHPLAQLEQWREQFFAQKIAPQLLPKARQRLEHHRQQGDRVIIITATNRFVTEPIANAYGVEDLIATEPERVEGRYTGEVWGTPCFQHGKVERLQQWLSEQQQSLAGSWFYSDSHNDLPLLERVSHPVAVDADATLTQIALERGWQQLSLR